MSVEDAVRRLIEIAAGREARLSEAEADELLAGLEPVQADAGPVDKSAGKAK